MNEPTIGIFDMALAAQARGLMSFGDIGAMTKAEVNQLFEILIEYKQRGHFNGIWNSVPQSIEFMKSGRVVIESMFSPAASALNGHGIPVEYAAPREGYRAWHGVMCLSSKTTGAQADKAYAYMNWWLSGWPGGVYRPPGVLHLQPAAVAGIPRGQRVGLLVRRAPRGPAVARHRQRDLCAARPDRRGGSYERRFSNVAVWNTVMDTYEHSLSRWYELLTA